MKERIAYAARCASHPAFILGSILTAVGIAFNVSHGFALGGSDPLRAYGMAGVFLAAIVAKDAFLGKTFAACKARSWGLALVCAVAFSLGAVTSLIAAVGAASEGREEKADPKAAQITAYNTAEKIATDAEKRIAELGRVATVGEARASVAASLARVDSGIAKRTSGCENMNPEGSGARQIAVNRQACDPVQSAKAALSRAEEVARLRDDLADARATISKGKPQSADATAATFSAVFSIFTSEEIPAETFLVLVVALFVEIGAPFAWAAFQLSRLPTFSALDRDLAAFRRSLSERLPESQGPTVADVIGARRLPDNEPTPPKPGKRAKPSFSGNVVDLADRHPVVKTIRENGGSVASNRALAKLMGCSDGEATKRRAEVAHLLIEEKVGKEQRISLRA